MTIQEIVSLVMFLYCMQILVVLDFGGAKTATNGDFTIAFPDAATPANAIISMS